MCYRATQTNKAYEYAEYYSAQLINELDLNEQIYYHANGFAHPNLVTIAAKDGARQAERMQWGLMPNWKKPLTDMLKLSNNTLNAKSETIFDLTSFKGSIMTKRCILPVNGFFEYKEVNKDKLPYFIHPKEHPFFNLACIYAFYQDPENQQWHKSFSIVTAPANELMASIHNVKLRQPVIISNEQINSWLDPSTSKEEVIHLMQPCDDRNMAAYRVDRDLIKIGNEPEALAEVPETTLL
ncbi:MAG: SOS response-associated peptidase [Sphingobacteriaceae bacterium]|nr:SOS response-associated peptidase [Sphingobacteriaceae bacterium]